MALNPQLTYVHLAESGTATQLPGGEAFWSLPQAAMVPYATGWLISEFELASDWPNWEMHPHADEFVYLLSGAVELHLEEQDGLRRVALNGCGAILVPRGVWHTAKVKAPSRMLHVTRGEGTQLRPAQQG
jgi:mannose-6-phosphate isomerase-like protein (cupin superfamily)